MISATYQVTGMICEHCARAVREELALLAGVTGVTVGLVRSASGSARGWPPTDRGGGCRAR